jgi:hypothetical protein
MSYPQENAARSKSSTSQSHTWFGREHGRKNGEFNCTIVFAIRSEFVDPAKQAAFSRF